MILYIILIIVIFNLLYNKLNNFEGFGIEKEKTKKCLLVYYGGAFREGIIGTTIQDTDYGYESQERASITHAKLKKVLNKKGYHTDIIINTRTTKYVNKLQDWYSPFNMIINNLSDRIYGKDIMIQSAIKNINNLNKDDYDFILFVRIDLFLKPEFYNVINTETKQINFLANNFDPTVCNNYTRNKNPKIVDLILLIPKKYYYVLDEKFKLNHTSIDYLKPTYHLKDSDFSFMSNKMFDSNSMMDHNPYYCMSSRKENKTTHATQLFNNESVKKCKEYIKSEETYIDNPTKYYIDKYNHFYKKDS